MYIDAYIAVLLWVLALYGFYYLMRRAYASLNLARQAKKGGCALVVFSKNQEEAIEGVVRSFILQSGMDSLEEKLLKILLLDLGSGDSTREIMEKLDRDYTIVKCLKPDELPDYIRSLV